ncbi:MAG: ABC transporter permease [Lachnospiraceae bacterium]|nr:ABC transporter permease [Lachnospiraceae bacterium]
MIFYLKKAAGLLVTLILVSVITFGVFQILPGNPVYIILGVDADPAQAAALEKALGLDRPMAERYLDWIAGLFRGDLGMSYRYQQPVSELLSSALEVTGSLAVVTLVLTVLIGVPVGIWLAGHSHKKYSVIVSMLSQVSLSVPGFCMAVFLSSVFAVSLRWLPSMGFVSWSDSPVEWLRSLLLPSLSLALGSSSVLIRYVKVSVTNQQKQDYVRTAYSKGLKKTRVMYGHVVRNSLIPVITILGMTAADILGGSIIIENVFSMPGIGRLISVSITSRDLPLLQGLTLYLAVIVVVCNFVVDLIYSVVDPRIRLK